MYAQQLQEKYWLIYVVELWADAFKSKASV